MEQRKIIYCTCRFVLAVTLFLTSCIAEETEIDAGTGKESIVKFSVQMPQSAVWRKRSISEEDENHVKEIDILAFKSDQSKSSGWAFNYRTEGRSITNAGEPGNSNIRFIATLFKNSNEQTFVILANVREEINRLGTIAEGADKDALLERLISSNNGKWNVNEEDAQTGARKTFTPFPMWGETSAVINDAAAVIEGAALLRSVARVDVSLSDKAIAAGNFKLHKIFVYNSKNRGHIVPARANRGDGTVKAATIPAGDINNNAAVEYAVPETMQYAFRRSIYLYEAEKAAKEQSSQATAVVVGGIYGADSAPSYYRLDFLSADKTACKDILRNHRYDFTIISVSGRGYGTPDEAFNAKPVNMEAEIIAWDEGEIGDIIFDGQYHLGVSPTELILSKEAATGNSISVITDVPGGWKITGTSGSNAPISGFNVDWINNIAPFSGTENMKGSLSFDTEKNDTGTERTAYIHIKAGRLCFAVKVTQGITLGTGVENYHTEVEVADAYYLDGNICWVTVRSNTEWAVKPGSLEDPDGILDIRDISLFTAQSGGYNTVSGNKLYFRVVNDELFNKSGKTASFILTDPQKKVSEILVAITGVTCGANGIANPIKTGVNGYTDNPGAVGKPTYLTHVYGTGVNRRCWMVQNSKEGSKFLGIAYGLDAFGQEIGDRTEDDESDTHGRENGYYYTWEQANSNACPPGWRLPTEDELNSMMSEINADTSGKGKWWTGNSGKENNAFAGHFFNVADNYLWYDWNQIGYWWYASKEFSYTGNTDKLDILGEYSDPYYGFSVRCVRSD